MDWQLDGIYILRILLSALLGALVGWEREFTGTEAGIRTHMAVCIGSCAFTLISSHVPGADPTRIASQVVMGIGFIGAGVIINEKGRVSGLTTAAGLWAIAAAGMATAYGMYCLAAITAIMVYGTLHLQRLPLWPKIKRRKIEQGDDPPCPSDRDQ